MRFIRPVLFGGPAQSYDRYMGRYAPTLAVALCDAVGVVGGDRVLDVGCGPGGLTHELVSRTGASNVAAIDPAPQFVEACRARNPGADVRVGVAEDLPWPEGTFDTVLSSLVIAFMRDPDVGLEQMGRVTRPGGTIGVCMWDLNGHMPMLDVFWDAVRRIDPAVRGERHLTGAAQGDIVDRLRRVGLDGVVEDTVSAHADYVDFDDFWTPFLAGIGPAGQHLVSLPPEQQTIVREHCRANLPGAPFTLSARAWFGRGTVPARKA